MLTITFTPEQKSTSQNERHVPSDDKSDKNQEFADVFEADAEDATSVDMNRKSQDQQVDKHSKPDSAEVSENVEEPLDRTFVEDENNSEAPQNAKKIPFVAAEVALHLPQNQPANISEPSEITARGGKDDLVQAQTNRTAAKGPPTPVSAVETAQTIAGSIDVARNTTEAETVMPERQNALTRPASVVSLALKSAPGDSVGKSGTFENSAATSLPQKPREGVTRTNLAERKAEADMPLQTTTRTSPVGQTETAMRSLMQPADDVPQQGYASRAEHRDHSRKAADAHDAEFSDTPKTSAAKPSEVANQVAFASKETALTDKLETAKLPAFSANVDEDADIQMMPSLDIKSTTSKRFELLVSQPEMPKQIARQLADVMRMGPDRPVELTLNPEELGRVRLSLSSLENGMSVTILAERGETMDLMRRHIDQLTREFHALGYQNVAFSFGQQSQHGADENGASTHQSAQSNPSSGDTLDPSTAGAVQLTLGDVQGVDIRL